jgi:hypothetical protein
VWKNRLVKSGHHPTARKWVITAVINGISRVNPLITGVITHLLSGMSHQVVITCFCYLDGGELKISYAEHEFCLWASQLSQSGGRSQ